jgi:hypothetical protein
MGVQVASGYAPAVPLTHARILYASLPGVAASTGEADGFPATSADNPLTYSGYVPDALPATWTKTLDGASPWASVDCVGIAAHTLGTSGVSVTVEYTDGGSPEVWTPIMTHIPADDSPIMLLFDPVSAAAVRLVFESFTSPETTPFVGVIYIGEALAMQRALYGGHSPIDLARITVIRPNKSERGQWLGRSIIRSGSAGAWSWRHLKADWYRTYFDPFVESARTQPFFIAWRPETYPVAAYCWTEGDITPSNMGVKDFMQVTLEAEGLAIE